MDSDMNKQNIAKLEEIASLKKNWNGHGAEAFSKCLISKVGNIVSGLSIQPEIFPTACGTIQLEWETERLYVEIEISESDTAEVFTVSKSGMENTSKIYADSATINNYVSCSLSEDV